ncbi:SMR family transporter, partial [Neisseria meningitidis]
MFHRGRPHSREPVMSWFILFIAGLLEVVWAIGLKYTHGFTRLIPSLITVTAMIDSIIMLTIIAVTVIR